MQDKYNFIASDILYYINHFLFIPIPNYNSMKLLCNVLLFCKLQVIKCSQITFSVYSKKIYVLQPVGIPIIPIL